jgi:ABC-type multidrug transport system ATPase subunit
MVGLATVARRKIKTFSGGMKRRLGIAQALINDPQLLIVDEPTAGLDPEERIRFRNLLSNSGSNRTVLLSTHIVEDIAQSCQRLALLKNGRLLFQGSVHQMIEETRGNVWIITNAGTPPEGNVTVVSSLNMGASVQYRVVGSPSHRAEMTPVEPSLEDSYVWFMRNQ